MDGRLSIVTSHVYIWEAESLEHESNCLLFVSDKDKDSFIGLQEFVVGYSKAPEQPQNSARPICHSHAMTSTGHEPATICIAA